MEKERLTHLIHTYQELKLSDYEWLQTEVKKYPYFQAGHVLMAKYASDQKLENTKPLITHAAFVTTHRSILKQVIENNLLTDEPVMEAPETKPAEVENEVAVPSKTPPENAADPTPAPAAPRKKVAVEDIDMDHFFDPTPEEKAKAEKMQHLYNEIKANLDSLHSIKEKLHAYDEDLFANMEKSGPANHPDSAPPLEPPAPSGEESSQEDDEKKNLTEKEDQRQIIDHFIENNIQRPQETATPSDGEENTPPKDLSERSQELTDDLITESLANLYLKQGKKEKALDIYNKLIWKFPQKKAYFASLIENLKRED